MTNEAKVFVGIDISKETLDLAIVGQETTWQLNHDETGISQLIDLVTPMNPQLIVMEATGGLEIDIVTRLSAAGLPISVVNPVRVREFAKAIGQYAKTDRIDAQLIVGQTLTPESAGEMDANLRETDLNQLETTRVDRIDRG